MRKITAGFTYRIFLIFLVAVFALSGCSASTSTEQGQTAAQDTKSLEQTNTEPVQNAIRVNCGADTEYTDAEGKVWFPDQPYSKGSWGYTGGNPIKAADTISGTKDSSLYQTMRSGEPSMTYKFTVPKGNYEVTFKFAEAEYDVIGPRLFNVAMEGKIYIYNLDLAAEAGKNAAYDKTFVIEVKDGILNVGFTNLKDKAVISAISVVPTTAKPDPLPQPTPPPTPKESAAEIDEAVTYQTIEGFGGFGSKKVWWGSKPFYDDEWNDMLINDLGLTILRDHLPENFKKLDQKGKAYINLNERTNDVDGVLADHLPYLKAMKAAGLQKLIVTIWSPPGWMKTNEKVRGGGSLKPEFYKEFAQYVIDYIKTIKKETGLDVYAISLQNEPAFEEPYASCVYTPEQYRDMIKAVVPRMRAAGIKTKIFMPEDVQWHERVMKYINAIMNDEKARQYVDIIAVHGYAFDGITADSPDAKTWDDLYQTGIKYGKQVWMTETSGFPDGWEGGMKHAQAMYTALKYGKISAWVYWYTTDIAGLPQYYVSKNFYRYIRPGAVQIDIKTDNPDVLALAFKHEKDKTVTLVFINKGSSEKKVKINIKSGSLPEEFNAYRTSASENCIDAGKVSVRDEITLSANSITTLYGTNK